MNKDKIISITIKSFFIFLLNGIGFSIIIMLFLDSNSTGEIKILLEKLNLPPDQIKMIIDLINPTSFFSDLDFKIQALLIFLQIIMMIITIPLLTMFYKEMREDKRSDKKRKKSRLTNETPDL